MLWNLVLLGGWYLAVARVTRILTHDRITEDARIWFMHKVGVQSLLAYYVNCMWCVSIWVAGLSMPVAVYMAGRTWPQAAVFALGASYFTGMMSGLDSEEIEIEESTD
jgi:hypothetical protein